MLKRRWVGTITPVASLAILVSAGSAGCGRGTEQSAASAPGPASQSSSPPPGSAELPPGHPPIESPGISTVPAHAPTQAASGDPGAAAGAGGGPGGGSGGGPVWTAPAGWKQETPSSPMRRAQYRVPAGPGDPEDGECVVYYFGAGQGGDIPSNIERWSSQFTGWTEMTKPRSTEVKVGGLTVTRVEAAGTYHPSSMAMAAGTPPAPKPGFMLLGAIIPAPDANWFLKCTGPEKTMSANRAAFNALIGSIRLEP